MIKAYINWSSGKDATMALYALQQNSDFTIGKLVTTVDSTSSQISMHGIRKELLLQQAENLQIPLRIIDLPGNVPLIDYNLIMLKETSALVEEGFTHSVFGDIFLEDLKNYREEQLAKIGLKAVFPLWKMNTSELIRKFIKEGFKAITVCVNAKFLDQTFCGRIIDENFLADLPAEVDPCGENGEFHTFVYDGPLFNAPVQFIKGEIYPDKKGMGGEEDPSNKQQKKAWDTNFWYCDLLPK